MKNHKSYVSVIITTKQEEENIANCLRSVKNQTYPQENIEIIVVDNDSTDRTKDIACQYTDKVYNYGPERSAQRNFGARKANGKYILYLDADMILSKNVINECVEKCEEEGYIALYIPEKILGKGLWAKIREFERGFYNATYIDSVRFVRRDKFFEVKGFDENLTACEDWDFDRRINKIGKISIIKSPLYHNEGKITLRKYLQKKTYYTTAFAKYIQKWDRKDPIVKKQFGLYYRYWGVFIENGKWKRLLRHPFLFFLVFLVRILVGVVFTVSKLRKI